MFHPAVILLLLAQSGVPQVQKPVLDQSITIQQKSPTLTSLLFEIAEKTGINIVSDSYLSDTMGPDLHAKDVKLQIVLNNINEIFGREHSFQDGILIFREKNWFMRRQLDSKIEKQSSDKGIIFQGEATTDDDPRPISLLKNPKKVTIVAKQARLTDILKSLSEQSGWNIKADPTVATRRLTLILRNVHIEKALFAITSSLEASQTVTIGKSKEQMAFEENFLTDSPTDQAIRAAQELLPELFDNLSESQQKDVIEGKRLSLDVKSLTGGLKEKCLSYIELSLRMMKANSVDIPIDRSQINQATINILDYRNLKRLSVSVFGTDGNLYTF